MSRKTLFIVGGLVVIGGIIGLIIALSVSGGDDATSSNNSSGGSNSGGNISDGDILTPDADDATAEPSSNPDSAAPVFTMLAIGDWGATTYKEGSCCNRYRKNSDTTSQDYQKDYHAQLNVAELLAKSAAELNPVAILGHGDNVYWNGVGPKDASNRMAITFDGVYTQSSLQNVPWWNVAGNHDIGGSMYLCGEADNQFVPCTSVNEMLSALDAKFNLQRDYVSPINNRWIMTDHYYKTSHSQGGVSVDVFHVDTNYADSHAAHQVCCQCYGYSAGDSSIECKSVQKGNQYCAGGNAEMYEACMNKIKTWWDDSIQQVERDLAASTATYKVINTHYSPHFHMGEDKMKVWYKICKDHNVHVWFNGHTHGFNHDISKWETHFFENGGGGGIQSETSGHRPAQAESFVDTEWIGAGAPYGFFELSFSADWLKVQFVTFDTDWVFSLTASDVKVGGIKRDHCWHVGRVGRPGKACAAAA